MFSHLSNSSLSSSSRHPAHSYIIQYMQCLDNTTKEITWRVMRWSVSLSQVSRKGARQCSRVWRGALSGKSSCLETTLSSGCLSRLHHCHTAALLHLKLCSDSASFS